MFMIIYISIFKGNARIETDGVSVVYLYTDVFGIYRYSKLVPSVVFLDAAYFEKYLTTM